MNRRSTIAVLGTGLLGRAIAERLHGEGRTVVAYNRTESKALPLQTHGIAIVARPEHAIAQADCALLVLADTAAIRSVLFTPSCEAALRRKTVIQMGTIAANESLVLQREIDRIGAYYCEAPVLGSVTEAKDGRLLLMVGGTEAQFREWFPLFTLLSREPRYVGTVGQAATLKLALNQLIAAGISAFALSLGLVQRAGIPVDSFMAILRESALFAPTFDKKLPRLLARDYSRPNFSTSHLLKDVDLFLRQASALELAVTSLEGIKPVLERTIAKGLGNADYSAIYEEINPEGRSQSG